ILAQSFGDFDLTLADDAASDEYRAYIEALGDPRVRYVPNPTRLGAMKNMFAAIARGRGKYVLVFHEDDLLAEGFLAAAIGILGRQPSCGFVAAELHEFRDEPDPADLARIVARPAHEVFSTGADFLRAIFRGVEPMFGSIVYRREAIAGIEPELTHY